MNHHDLGRGIGLSVLASTLFALLSGYTRLLQPLDGTTIFWWRILWTAVAALALLLWRKRGRELLGAARELTATPARCATLVAMAALLGLQQWIFLWGSVNGRALEISLGYFLLPLTMVLTGRLCYGERLNGMQRLAVLFALVGVAHELWATRAFSWPTLVVALGYPPYFILRRRIKLDSLLLFAVEILVMVPLAIAVLAVDGALPQPLQHPALLILLPALGGISMVALASYLKAGKLLPMGLFGILGYVEPVLLVLVAMLVLGEQLQISQLGTYVPIWLSVACTAVHSVRLMRARTGLAN